MSAGETEERLERSAPGAWELYRKEGVSRELHRVGAERREASRRERGCAARWWNPAPRFAAAGSPEQLGRLLSRIADVPATAAEPPDWPEGAASEAASEPALEAPPDLFDELARAVAVESRGEASLAELSLRRGRSVERIVNAGGLDVTWRREALTGFAAAVGRRGSRSCEARATFRSENGIDLPALARRLTDRAILPLSDRSTPVDRGDWLLDPSVAAALLASLAPLFTRDPLPAWAAHPNLLPPDLAIVDDASPDAPFDGEGTRTRRVVVADRSAIGGRLHDLVSAKGARVRSTGHGVRRSYRTPPARAARRIFFEAERPLAQKDLLAAVRRGVFASALIAPLSCDLENDRYEAQFTGVAIVAGRAAGPVAAARARGRISQLLRRITAIGSDRQFFPLPDPVGGATLLFSRVSFD